MSFIQIIKKINFNLILRYISEYCFQSQCILCSNPAENNISLCLACKRDLPWLTYVCFKCGQPLSTAIRFCGACLRQTPPYFRTLALFHYDDLIAHCISLLKFQKCLTLGKTFGVLMAEYLLQHYQNDIFPECIIPLPLHEKRLKERGYNQALELARPISTLLKLPIDVFSCERIKATLPQANTLSVEERRKNVKNAFKLLLPLPYKHIALVDDVMTTGSTVAACANALMQGGVRRVDIWCCARTGGHFL